MTEDRITNQLRRRAKLIGDDCAIIRPRANEDLLFTTDFSIEAVHFPRDAAPYYVGRRALARSVSDIAAMGGTPRYCLVSLALAPWTDDKWIDGFYRGLLKLAREYKTDLAGGDLSHANQLVCDVMVCGSVPKGKALRRDGARPGDAIYVSGPLGGWQHKPEPLPRLEFGRRLRGRASACMDISDGLALDLHRLCVASGVSAEIESVPLLEGAGIEEALHAGEDYELLYTARNKVPGYRIGTIRAGKPGRVIFQGKVLPLLGYDHLQYRN